MRKGLKILFILLCSLIIAPQTILWSSYVDVNPKNPSVACTELTPIYNSYTFFSVGLKYDISSWDPLDKLQLQLYHPFAYQDANTITTLWHILDQHSTAYYDLDESSKPEIKATITSHQCSGAVVWKKSGNNEITNLSLLNYPYLLDTHISSTVFEIKTAKTGYSGKNLFWTASSNSSTQASFHLTANGITQGGGTRSDWYNSNYDDWDDDWDDYWDDYWDDDDDDWWYVYGDDDWWDDDWDDDPWDWWDDWWDDWGEFSAAPAASPTRSNSSDPDAPLKVNGKHYKFIYNTLAIDQSMPEVSRFGGVKVKKVEMDVPSMIGKKVYKDGEFKQSAEWKKPRILMVKYKKKKS